LVQREIEKLIKSGWELIRGHQRPVRASYRVQFDPRHFKFADATKLVTYLDALGISHLYAPPHLKARAGSTHGYDVIEHGQVNPELGSEEELAELHGRLGEKAMSMLVDWVPNHMGTGAENALWMDVLESGPSSAYARFFDIDWHPFKTGMSNKVLVPLLGDQYGVILERRELKLRFERGAFSVGYWEHRFPVAMRGYAQVLSHELERLVKDAGNDAVDVQELQSIITSINNLPPATETDAARNAEGRREKEVVKRRLAALYESSATVRAHVDRAIEAHNGQADAPESLALLDRLMSGNAYRLAYWRVAGEEINYRRFFDINELAAIRMEDPEVFRHTHRLLVSWIAKGWIRAMRIDHPDGLYDPTGYFRRLQAAALTACCREAHARQDGEKTPWEQLEAPLSEKCLEEVAKISQPASLPLYVVVEKILARRERVPTSWAVNGTTGYDFLNAVNGLFVDRDSESVLTTLYLRLAHQKPDFAELVSECKRFVLRTAFAPEVQVLAHRLVRIAESDYRTRDFTLGSLTAALTEIIAFFPVYRTYIGSGDEPIDERDRQYVEQAVARAKRGAAATSTSVFDFVRDILLKNHPPRTTPEQIEERTAFTGKFQQLTPPALAKGMEDTAFYRYNRLVAQNEVGGEPERMGVSVGEFHAQNRERVKAGSASLLSTTTHDTKRGEDARLRIDALSEMPIAWRRQLSQWVRLNRRYKKDLDGRPAPDRNDEYLLYQTLVGTWPGGQLDGDALETYIRRLEAYMMKAVREAKVHSSWINQDPAYEEACAGFVRAVLSRPPDDPFISMVIEWTDRVAWAARQSSLSQVVLKVASPGVPDFYQGSEEWDLRLVDPDNRGPVDFVALERRLDELITRAAGEGGLAELVRELTGAAHDPRIKLFTIWRCLQLRRRHPETFTLGDYTPLDAAGKHAPNVVALSRSSAKGTVVAVVGRMFARLREERAPSLSDAERTGLAVGPAWWETTRVMLPAAMDRGRFKDQLTGRAVSMITVAGQPCLNVAEVFAVLPVALLEWQPGSS
jgi:(1->4)-alpha-D-glucan 1-alpha-D-glucosylmutase